jgi:uncharacterized protein YprB with RNaseH-like and TPR domain
MTQEEAVRKVFPSTENSAKETISESASGFGDEWIARAYKVLKRSIVSSIDFDVPQVLPDELKVLVPDFMRRGHNMFPESNTLTETTHPANCRVVDFMRWGHRKSIAPEDLLFFDLETTGLSGGAGTVAFLAALGFFVPSKKESCYKLQIDQYLLLDYPGEPEFLETIIPILNDDKKIIVTYNGKSFDTKLFRTRCLMNGMKPPVYEEADLLHPARRLWKNILQNCSQAEIETSILGLDRTGDISGAFAPQIWFDYLNSQNPAELLKMCDHNTKDIEGLASIFSLISKISAHPLETLAHYRFDIEAAALRWRDCLRLFPDTSLLEKCSEELIHYCVNEKYPKAMYLFATDLMKKNFHDEGISLLHELADMEIPCSLKISVLNSLAIDAEWRKKDSIQALNHVEALLLMENLSESFRNKTTQRYERLRKKLTF